MKANTARHHQAGHGERQGDVPKSLPSRGAEAARGIVECRIDLAQRRGDGDVAIGKGQHDVADLQPHDRLAEPDPVEEEQQADGRQQLGDQRRGKVMPIWNHTASPPRQRRTWRVPPSARRCLVRDGVVTSAMRSDISSASTRSPRWKEAREPAQGQALGRQAQ